MGGENDRRRRHLVEVPNLEPNDAILDLVDDPDPVPPPELGRALEQVDEPERLAVQGHRDSPARSRPGPARARSGASSGWVTSSKTSAGGGKPRSSIAPPSEERPQRLSSIEYGGASVPPLTGIPCSRA